MERKKLDYVPIGYRVKNIAGQIGLGIDTSDGWEWLSSTPEKEIDLLKGLLGIIFTEEIVQKIYQEAEELLKK